MNGQPRRGIRTLPGRISYRMHGPGDYFHRVWLKPDGRFRVEQGSFRSAPPRIGRIDAETRQRLVRLLAHVAPLSSSSDAPQVEAFESELLLGEGRVPRVFRWSANSIGVPRALAALAEVMRGL